MENRVIGFFVRHYDELITIAVRMTKNTADAEDVMQNVAVVLCANAAKLGNVDNCGAYLAVCIRRAAVDLLRKKSRMQPTAPEILADGLPLYTQNADRDAFGFVEWTASLERHLSAYPEEMRQAFIAHYVEDVPLAQLSQRLGVSVHTLSARFSRMRKALRRQAHALFTQLQILMLL